MDRRLRAVVVVSLGFTLVLLMTHSIEWALLTAAILACFALFLGRIPRRT